MKKMFIVVFVVIGTLIGAGFATGKEIYIFFFKYGYKGAIGLCMSLYLLSLVIYLVLKIVRKNDISSYDEFLCFICKNKKLYKLYKIIVNAFLIISFYIMIAGFGAFFSQEINISKNIGIIIASIMCFYVFKNKSKGFVKVNTILSLILTISIFIIGILNGTNNLSNICEIKLTSSNINWVVSSFIYCGYNSIVLIPVVINMKKYIKNEKYNLLNSIIIFVITFILGQIIFILLLNLNNLEMLEIPIIKAIEPIGKIYKDIFGIVILISIFTSAISAGYSFLKNVSDENYNKINIVICSLAIIISQIGFSNLLNTLYPLFGIIGIIQIVLIIEKTKAKME